LPSKTNNEKLKFLNATNQSLELTIKKFRE